MIAGVVAWWWLHGRGTEPAPDDRSVSQTPSVRPTPAAERSAPRPPRDDLTFEELSALLQRHASHLRLTEDTIRTGRRYLIVHYSLDSALQRYAAALLRRYRPKYGAIALIESVSGRVLTLVSYAADGEPYLGRDLYCRSFFPAASVFKIVSAAGAIEKGGLTPDSELRYAGRNYTLYKNQLAPTLREYRTATLQYAFSYSINPVFGRVGIHVLGGEGLREYARRFGFSQAVPFDLPIDTPLVGACDSAYAQAEIASGFNQETRISPLFGALIAGAVSENGVMPVPFVVDSITDMREWRRVYRATPRTWRVVMRQETAAHLVRMMQEVVRAGTARESFSIVRNTRAFEGMRFGGKTGSVDRDGIGRVDWFVGFVCHPTDPRRRLAAGVVTVHGALWTVHSSYLAAELFRYRLRALRRPEVVAEAAVGGSGDG